MKKLPLILFLILSSFVSRAQIQDLASLAEGDLDYSTIISDKNGDIYGYLYNFNQGKKEDDKIGKSEVILLDKNLNKVANIPYEHKLFKRVNSSIENITKIGDNLILCRLYTTYKYDFIIYTFQLISLKDKTVGVEKRYVNGEFVDFNPDYKKFKKESDGAQDFYFHYAFENKTFTGFFIRNTDYNLTKNYEEKKLKAFDENFKPIWTYVFNPNGKRSEYVNLKWEYIKDNNAYCSESTIKKEKSPGEFKIICLNLQTGEKKYEYVLENLQTQYSHTLTMREYDNKLYLTGNYSLYNKKDGFQLDNNLGYYRIILDDKGNKISEKYTQWEEFKSQIDVDKWGKVEKNYRLRPTKFFIFKDGTISILTEKYEPMGLISNPKTTDFILFTMDTDFNLKGTKTINKEKTVLFNYDYLFSQYIKDDSGAVFFYRDYVDNEDKTDKNKKQWILGITTILDGNLKEEKIPISSDKNTISPAPAKEGYIMLREYNEKDKYNQIRLEKLNY